MIKTDKRNRRLQTSMYYKLKLNHLIPKDYFHMEEKRRHAKLNIIDLNFKKLIPIRIK